MHALRIQFTLGSNNAPHPNCTHTLKLVDMQILAIDSHAQTNKKSHVISSRQFRIICPPTIWTSPCKASAPESPDHAQMPRHWVQAWYSTTYMESVDFMQYGCGLDRTLPEISEVVYCLLSSLYEMGRCAIVHDNNMIAHRS